MRIFASAERPTFSELLVDMRRSARRPFHTCKTDPDPLRHSMTIRLLRDRSVVAQLDLMARGVRIGPEVSSHSHVHLAGSGNGRHAVDLGMRRSFEEVDS